MGIALWGGRSGAPGITKEEEEKEEEEKKMGSSMSVEGGDPPARLHYQVAYK